MTWIDQQIELAAERMVLADRLIRPEPTFDEILHGVTMVEWRPPLLENGWSRRRHGMD